MTRSQFTELLSQQSVSGLSIRSFCHNYGYSKSTFYYWKRKFKVHRESSDTFVPVSFHGHTGFQPDASPCPETTGEIMIEFPGGIKIHFRGNQSQSAMQLITPICNHHVLSK